MILLFIVCTSPIIPVGDRGVAVAEMRVKDFDNPGMGKNYEITLPTGEVIYLPFAMCAVRVKEKV